MPLSNRPLKHLGQNFLTSVSIQKKIVAALQITSKDTVLEIGPGKGALSEHIIARHPAAFYAVELDRRWCDLLNERFAGRMTVLNEDFLSSDLKRFGNELKIIGNIPYNISSPIFFKLVDEHVFIHSAVLMMQKEVARRLTAAPGGKEYGILSVVAQSYAEAEYLFEVRRGNFFPRPEVDSAVVRLHFHKTLPGVDNPLLYRRIVRHCFNYRRKMLRNSLSRIFDKSIVYSLTAVDLNLRPEQLTVQHFKDLANELNLLTGSEHG